MTRIREATGLNMSLHPSGPKWTLTCGYCGYTWRQRIGKNDNPGALCDACGTVNTIPIEWN